MFSTFTSLIDALRSGREGAADRVQCFHCGEKVRRKRAIAQQFDGEPRLVCCHGCAAVLQTVEQMGLCAQYRDQKLQAASPNEQ